MQIFWTLASVVQIVSALAMIGLVLVQHGKGADMGASFGSGSSGSLFGATGSANFLSRTTAVCAALFFVTTLALAGFSQQRGGDTGSSVLERAADPSSVSAATIGASAAASGAVPVESAASAAPSEAPAPAASGAAAIPTK